MKIRNGFVSNSSSSSFCIMVTKKGYEEALKDCDSDAQKLIKHWAKKGKIGSEDVVYFFDMTNNGGYSTMTSPEYDEGLEKFQKYIDDKMDGDFSAVWCDFEDKLPKGSFIKADADM